MSEPRESTEDVADESRVKVPSDRTAAKVESTPENNTSVMINAESRPKEVAEKLRREPPVEPVSVQTIVLSDHGGKKSELLSAKRDPWKWELSEPGQKEETKKRKSVTLVIPANGVSVESMPESMEDMKGAMSPMARFIRRTELSPIKKRDRCPSIVSDTGKKENWWIPPNDLELEDEPFSRGACGEVYRGQFRKLEVVVKQAMANSSIKDLKDIRREIALWRSIRHPNIVLFIGASFDPMRGVMIVMEDMKGFDLKKRVQTKKFSKAQMLDSSMAIAMGLAMLHGNDPPILHRDLKPENILFDEYGRAKIADFGLSRLEVYKEDKYVMTGMTGTLRYMAPEVIRNEPYDIKVDVYSLGLLMYYMASGRTPFALANRDKRIQFAKNHKDYKVPPQAVSQDIKLLVEKCTLDDKAKRPTAAECVDELRAIVAQSSGACCVVS